MWDYNKNPLHTHRHDFFDQAHNVFGVVGAVRIVRNAAAKVGFDAVLVDDPIEGGTVVKVVSNGFMGYGEVRS